MWANFSAQNERQVQALQASKLAGQLNRAQAKDWLKLQPRARSFIATVAHTTRTIQKVLEEHNLEAEIKGNSEFFLDLGKINK